MASHGQGGRVQSRFRAHSAPKPQGTPSRLPTDSPTAASAMASAHRPTGPARTHRARVHGMTVAATRLHTRPGWPQLVINIVTSGGFRESSKLLPTSQQTVIEDGFMGSCKNTAPFCSREEEQTAEAKVDVIHV